MPLPECWACSNSGTTQQWSFHSSHSEQPSQQNGQPDTLLNQDHHLRGKQCGGTFFKDDQVWGVGNYFFLEPQDKLAENTFPARNGKLTQSSLLSMASAPTRYIKIIKRKWGEKWLCTHEILSSSALLCKLGHSQNFRISGLPAELVHYHSGHSNQVFLHRPHSLEHLRVSGGGESRPPHTPNRVKTPR